MLLVQSYFVSISIEQRREGSSSKRAIRMKTFYLTSFFCSLLISRYHFNRLFNIFPYINFFVCFYRNGKKQQHRQTKQRVDPRDSFISMFEYSVAALQIKITFYFWSSAMVGWFWTVSTRLWFVSSSGGALLPGLWYRYRIIIILKIDVLDVMYL